MIELKNVSKTYHVGKQRVSAISDISLQIKKGDFITISGKSGSGKSTLLNIMGGLDLPSSGHVFFEDKDLAHMNDSELSKFRNRHIGFVFQDYLLLDQLSVLENILSPTLFGQRENKKDLAKKLASAVGLGHFSRHKPSQLSGGQKQRVAIARALITNPLIILADEPTGNLDSKTGLEIIALFKKLNAELQTTFIVATHDSEIAKIARKRIHLTDGVLG